jgi:hypothetical protein
MAKVSPFHGRQSAVYHDNSRCTEGKNIERRNRVAGRGGRRKCARCRTLG